MGMKSIKIDGCNKINTRMSLPGDKSISHRSMLISSISEGDCRISRFLMSEDCLNTMRAMRSLGVNIEQTSESDFIVHGVGLDGLSKPKDTIDMGNSGTGMRLIAGLLASQNFTSVVTGDESLVQRPMKRIIDPLVEMGASIEARENKFPPLKICGAQLSAIEYCLPMASAQVKSAILLAGLSVSGETVVIEPAKSRNHTEKMLKYFGADIKVDGLKVKLNGGKPLIARDIVVPGDISSASFFMVAAAAMPGAKLIIEDVGLNPTRTGIVDVLSKMGADIQISESSNSQKEWGEPRGDIIVKGGNLKGITIEGDDIPIVIDEIPIIAVAGALSKGQTVIKDAKELRVKESDRIKTMVTNLKILGVDVTELEDGMIINGGKKLRGGVVNSFTDHRVAMSMAVAGLYADSSVVVEDTANIDTSFPGFKKYLKKITE